MAKGRKVKWGEAEVLLREWASSGEAMSSWCEARGLNWYSLSAFKGWGGGGRQESGFAEVIAQPASPAIACGRLARYRVEFGDVTVVVDDDFRPETLQRLLRTVAAC